MADVLPAPAVFDALARALTSHQHTAVLVLDGAGRVRFANPCASRVAAPGGAAMEGKDLRSLVTPQDLPVLDGILGNEGHGVLRLIRFADDGTPTGLRALAAVASSLEAEAGGGVLLMGWDATPGLVREARVRAAERFEVVGQLASGMAHELNNALSTVTTFSDLLLGGADPGSDQAQDLSEIKQAALDAAAIIRKLDLFSGGGSRSEKEQVHLPDVVRGLRKLLSRFLTRDVTLNVELDDATPPVMATPLMLEDVTVALATNARDALGGRGTVTIRVRPAGDPGAPTAVLEMVDSGTGPRIPDADQAVEAFFSTRPLGEGTGLGLSVVGRIVGELGGTFRMDPNPGGGTVVFIEVPGVAGASARDQGKE